MLIGPVLIGSVLAVLVAASPAALAGTVAPASSIPPAGVSTPLPGGPAIPLPAGPDSLMITARESPESPALSWWLACDPPGGTHPDPGRACDTLADTADPFAPVRIGVMCNDIYYGPQTATVTGWWRGQQISAQFSRVNGCQEARWEKIAAVLVLPVMPGPGAPCGPFPPVGPQGPQGPVLPRTGCPPGPPQGQPAG